jgi:hypothetical protein
MGVHLGKKENGIDKSLETTDIPTKEEVTTAVKKQQGIRPRWNNQ